MFAGPERHADIKHYLTDIANSKGITLEMVEFDILRDKSQDLTSDSAWETVWSRVCAGEFDFVILAPPCNTFSRARHNKQFVGPRPLRLLEYPRGFPWLKQSDAEKVQEANLLVDRSFLICHKCVELGMGFLLEHPEQLGTAQGLIPASIWNFQQFLDLEATQAICQAGIFQCEFGAPTSKPTCLATSAMEAFEESVLGKFMGPHRLDSGGQYLGPLPRQCPHGHHEQKLIGKSESGSWNTGPSASYPQGLCQAIAEMISAHLHRQARGGRQVSSGSLGNGGADLGDRHVSSGSRCNGVTDLGDKTEKEEDPEIGPREEEGDECFHGLLKQAAWDNAGLPMVSRWQNKQKSFADGGGLNSPGRWAPEDRGANLEADKKMFVDKLALLLKTFLLKHLPDMKRATFRLATFAESPFAESDLDQLRKDWFGLLGGADALSHRPLHQPFWLFAVEETLRLMGDEDVDIISKHQADMKRATCRNPPLRKVTWTS